MPNDIVSRAIDAVCAGDHLTADHAAAVLAEIMEGRADPVQTGAFLISLRAKGETVPELVGLARTMRSLATPVSTSRTDLVDTAGTGGGPSTFNVSTTAALVAAGAGCAIAKHGNRSNSSKCGSAELLEALGVNIELDADQAEDDPRPDGDASRAPVTRGTDGRRDADDEQGCGRGGRRRLPDPEDQQRHRQDRAAAPEGAQGKADRETQW